MRRPRLFACLIYLIYLAVAVLITWPLLTVISSRLLGHPFGDAYEYARHIWWFKVALQSGQPIFFQPLLAYPDGLPGYWLWSSPLQSFPAWLFALILPLPAAFNLSALLTLALNGWALHHLIWKWTGRHGSALVAGVIFLAYPTFQAQLGAAHVGLLTLWPLPLYIAALHDLATAPDRQVSRRLVTTALLFVLSLLGSFQLLLYLTLPVTLLFLLIRVWQRDWAAFRRIIRAGMLGGLLSLVFSLPAAPEILAAPPQVRERGDVTFSADLMAILSPSFMHPLFGQLDYTHRVLGVDPFEKAGYIGLAAGLLAAIGLWKRREARPWLALALAAWILSLGPLLKVLDTPLRLTVVGYDTGIILPWALYQQIPLLNFVRVPARFNFAIGLALAIMAGYGMCAVSNLQFPVSRKKARYSVPGTQYSIQSLFITVFLAALILWEYHFWWPEMPTISAVVPDAVAALATRDDVRAVLDVPWEHLLTGKDGLYLQTAHHKPLIAGHVARRTPVSPAKLTLLQETLDPALLNAAGADIIIVHKQWDADSRVLTLTRQRLGSPAYEDNRIAVFEAPDVETAPEFVSYAAPVVELPDRVETYFYAPQAGRVTFSGTLTAEGGDLWLYLDDAAVQSWTVDGRMAINVQVVVEAGYHSLTLAAQPSCPVNQNPALRCQAVRLSNLALRWSPLDA